MHQLSNEAKKFLSENQNRKIVFTNGCFDILHAGHISYLNEAKSNGDLLFIGLNSDKSIKRLKGETRPIITEKERKFILENLKCVDFVEIFSDDTPYDLIKAVRPQILVKGGDWAIENIVGHEIVQDSGGKVLSLQFVEGWSTTSIIEKIVKLSPTLNV